MSGKYYELSPEISRRDIDAGIRRAHVLRSRYIGTILSRAFRKSIKAIVAWNHRHNQGRHMAGLPDYLLKDMGIERHQIENVVSGALRRDPLSLSPTGAPTSAPAFWRGAAGRSSASSAPSAEITTVNKLAA